MVFTGFAGKKLRKIALTHVFRNFFSAKKISAGYKEYPKSSLEFRIDSHQTNQIIITINKLTKRAKMSDDSISIFKRMGLSECLANNLVQNGFDSFFEIQKLVIPKLLQNNSRRCIQPRHICASAPTGSGKTLAYVVPLLQALHRNHFAEVRLKAIVILPTRELAVQVHEVFVQLSEGLNISIGIATGQISIDQERENLVGDGSLVDLGFGCSVIDILVCTPGRLQDHILLTPSFTLEHLRFIVLDEADRLLGNAYHHWVKALVQSSTGSTTHGLNNTLIGTKGTVHKSTNQHSLDNKVQESNQLGYLPLSFLHGSRPRSVQRLLFSATLSDNPAKLALLGVKNPLIFRVGGGVMKSDIGDVSNPLSNGETKSEVDDDGIINDDDLHEKVDSEVDSEDDADIDTDSDDEDEDVDEDADGDVGDTSKEENGSSNGSGLLNVRRISEQVALANSKVTSAATETSESTQIGTYHLPPGLTESICVCETKHRPFALAALLYEACSLDLSGSIASLTSADKNIRSVKKSRMFLHSLRGYCQSAGDMVVVFASSVETAHRLAVLLQLLNGQVEDTENPGAFSAIKAGIQNSNNGNRNDSRNEDDSSQEELDTKKRKVGALTSSDSRYFFGGEVREMSRSLRPQEREETMHACRAGQVKILVATDQMARGIDLPNIKIAVNYDCPSDVKTYLHRVGRTARGRNEGHALTMLKVGQAGVFHALHKEIIPSDAQKVKVASLSEPSSAKADGSYPVLRSRPDPQVENGPLAKNFARALKVLPLVLAEWDSGATDNQRFFLQ